eukprot:1151686-Pelagomonas_calceolata.AAC.9
MGLPPSCNSSLHACCPHDIAFVLVHCRIIPNKANSTVTIMDSGIGMTKVSSEPRGQWLAWPQHAHTPAAPTYS